VPPAGSSLESGPPPETNAAGELLAGRIEAHLGDAARPTQVYLHPLVLVGIPADATGREAMRPATRKEIRNRA